MGSLKNGRYNVLFVFADQLGAEWTGCCGSSEVLTPTLDEFGRQAVSFDRAYTASPVCTPYRGTLFTGRYPQQTGVTRNGYRLPPGETTLAELFNLAGYHTAYYGKWHLSGPPHRLRGVPVEERGGFHEMVGWESHHVDHWNAMIFEDDIDSPIPLDGHETDGLTELVCSKLPALAALDKPFCAFVSYQAPHPPCSPPDRFREMYRGRAMHPRDNLDGNAVFLVQYAGEDHGKLLSASEYRERYFGEISHLDEAFGRLLVTVRNCGLDDSTIVVFTSDHGDMAGCQGLFEKGVMYEEAIRVPMLMRHPNGRRGETSGELFSSVDILPTLLECCGLPSAEFAEGVSHAGWIVDGEEKSSVREAVYLQYEQLCILTREYKLTADLEAAKSLALYHLSMDPYEQNNLVSEPEYADKAHELLGQLADWRKDILTRQGDTEMARC